MNIEKIGKFIAKKRKQKNLTQEQLSEKLNINNRTISRWENGKNMPDASLYKPLCEILDISVEELLNGEEKIKYDKNNNLKKIILILIMLLITILIIIIYYYKRYPKIDIYNIDIIKNNKKLLEVKEIDEKKIWFYNIETLLLVNKDNKQYDFIKSINHNQIELEDIIKFLNFQTENNNIQKNILFDGGTKIYNNDKYQIILCNTIDGNKDIYVGPYNMDKLLKGAYCNHKPDTTCYFTRTYHIVNIEETIDKEFVKVTLYDNKHNQEKVIINNSNNIISGKTYEFTFYTYDNFKDNIKNIFEQSTLIETKETNKKEQNQINDKICINKK